MFRNVMLCLLAVFVGAVAAEAQPATPVKVAEIQKGVWKLRFGTPEDFDLLSLGVHPPQTSSLDRLGEAALPFAPADIRMSVIHGKTYIHIPLQKEEQIYGLGLNFKTINIRQHIFRLHVDHYGSEDNGRNHAPVPFLVSSAGYGIFINSARYMDVYVGTAVRRDSRHPPVAIDRNTDPQHWSDKPYSDNIEVLVPAAGVEMYLFAGPTSMNAVQRFNLYFGGGVLPPKWGLGFWFRPWVHENASQADDLVKQFEENGFPLDVLGLEPGWQSKTYPCTYEWKKESFPDPAGFVKGMLGKNVRTNLWFNPYVSADAPVYPSLKPYFGSHTVWVGAVPDYTIGQARSAFEKYLQKDLLDVGVSGFKIDEVDGYDSWLWPDVATFPSGRDGEQMRQTYGLQMMKISEDMFRKRNQRTYGLIRASNAGAVSQPYVLYNDHYDHREYITAMINSGFSGVLWTPEVRTGGSAEDWIRRMQTVCFSPMAMINGYADSLLPWSFKEVKKPVLDVALLRMQLLPYLYSCFAQYHFEGKPPFRAVNLLDSFQYTGPLVSGKMNSVDNPYAQATKKEITDEYMMGDYLLVAPLFAGEKERKVLLPRGNWYDFYTGAFAGNGEEITVKAGLDKLPLFVCEGGVIPMMPPIRQTAGWKDVPLTVRVYGRSPGSFLLYDDDGVSFDYEKGNYCTKKLVVTTDSGKLAGKVTPVHSGSGWSYSSVNWKFMTE